MTVAKSKSIRTEVRSPLCHAYKKRCTDLQSPITTKTPKSSFTSSLLKIDGIGEKKAKALMKQFKTISAIKEASVEELSAVSGISKANAKSVYQYYRND